jgi:hypothetical protein
MRRMLLTAIATAALGAFAMPGVALAHHDGNRLGEVHHHHKRHHHHARRARLVTFQPANVSNGTSSGSTTPSNPVQETAGTIASFENEVLTITLPDGTKVSGKVTPDTWIECPSTTSASSQNGDDRGDDQGDDHHFDRAHGSCFSGDSGSSSPHSWWGHDGQDNDGNGEHQRCTPASLVQGASVTEAVLSITSTGATWVKVKL